MWWKNWNMCRAITRLFRSSVHVWPAPAVNGWFRPSRPIPKSFVGPALMAHILCCKYGYHLPLYRQSQMFENEGIDLSGSLMSFWVGKCTKLLERLSEAIRDHVFEAQAIFMDDTTVKLLQKGKGRGKNKSKTARLWVYARDESACSGAASPAVWYQFSTNRGAENISSPTRAMPMQAITMPAAQGWLKRWPVWGPCAAGVLRPL